MQDPFDLARFVDAQAGDYSRALRKLQSGSKRSHWMWYVFPQFAGLGTSERSRRYAIKSHAEAVAYLAHPVLGPRLRECTLALLTHRERSAREILGEPDHRKLQSSATLFADVDGEGIFTSLLERFFNGERDRASLELMRAAEGPA